MCIRDRHGRNGRRCGQVSPARQAAERDGMHDRVLRPRGTGTNRGLPPTHRQLPDIFGQGGSDLFDDFFVGHKFIYWFELIVFFKFTDNQ